MQNIKFHWCIRYDQMSRIKYPAAIKSRDILAFAYKKLEEVEKHLFVDGSPIVPTLFEFSAKKAIARAMFEIWLHSNREGQVSLNNEVQELKQEEPLRGILSALFDAVSNVEDACRNGDGAVVWSPASYLVNNRLCQIAKELAYEWQRIGEENSTQP